MTLERHIPKGYPRGLSELAGWEMYALARVAERFRPSEKRSPMESGVSYWAVAQTVSTMEHIVRREIEKMNHGAFLPTVARFCKVDGRDYDKERPLIGGYVFFLTGADDWAGLPDIHGVYDVLVSTGLDSFGRTVQVPKRVTDAEMARMVISHAAGDHNETMAPRYTKYFRGERPKPPRKSSRKPRPGRRIRNIHAQ